MVVHIVEYVEHTDCLTRDARRSRKQFARSHLLLTSWVKNYATAHLKTNLVTGSRPLAIMSPPLEALAGDCLSKI